MKPGGEFFDVGAALMFVLEHFQEALWNCLAAEIVLLIAPAMAAMVSVSPPRKIALPIVCS